MTKSETPATVQMTIEELADHVGGRVVGDGNRRIVGVGDLRLAGPEVLCFVRNSRYFDAARSSGAGGLLVPKVIDGCESSSQIVVDMVDAAFARIAQIYFPLPRATELRIHPSASVEASAVLEGPVEIGPQASVGADARIGPGTVVGGGCYVGDGVVLGRDCILKPRVVLSDGVRIGDRCILHSGVIIGGDGFGYAPTAERSWVKVPQVGSVVLGDDVEIGANSTIDRGTLGATEIRDGTKIDNLVHVGHNCRIGRHVAIAGFSAFSGSVTIGDRAICGGHTVASGHIRIGEDSRVGGNSVLFHGVPDREEVVGYPPMPRNRWFRLIRSWAEYAKKPRH